MKLISFFLLVFAVILGCNSDDVLEEDPNNFVDPNPSQCFEGIWVRERCLTSRPGGDTLKINPQLQLTLTTADCANTCNNNGPRTIQYYNILALTSDQFSLFWTGTFLCGDPFEESSDTMVLGYECKGDTLLFAGAPFILHSRYRPYP